ncbi:MAG: hypothetical protein DVB23_002738 [Verrucomicrobia bacterium]|jgi:hypothetical protein|nr:MAG: hypothetical protein DVB23_002738 [Verrucomicrobiota bacterium]
MIRAQQFPVSLSRETVMNIAAVAVSVAVNGMLLLLLGSWSVLQARQRLKVTAAPREELVVSLEEILPELVPAPVPAPPSAKQVFVETFSDQQADRSPERAPFESDKNTRAATEKVAVTPGAAPVPTQDGLDKVQGISMRDHNFADGRDGEIPRSVPTKPGLPVPVAAPQPMEDSTPRPMLDPAIPQELEQRPEKTSPTEMKAVAQPSDGKVEKAEAPKPEVPAGPAGGAEQRMEMAKVDLPGRVREMTQELDETAPKSRPEDAMPEKAPPLADPFVPMLQAPRVRPSAEVGPRTAMNRPLTPAVPAPQGGTPKPLTNGSADMAAFSPARRLNTMKGSLSNIGKSSVDAESTPVGIYKAAVSRAVERRWHELRLKNASFVSYGSLKIRFFVSSRGRVSGIRVVHQDAGAILTDFSIAAIASAAIPAMPPEVAEAFGDEPLEVNYDILIY